MTAAAVVLAILAAAAGARCETLPAEATAPARTVAVPAPERVLSFHSDIAVRGDDSLKVTETIRVIALGGEIRHGIYRGFPLRGGGAELEVIEVLRDGTAEPYHTVTLSSSTRVYMGKPDLLLEPGEYTYSLTYLIRRGATPTAGEEELDWSVNGFKWQFSMDRVSATVTLPESASPGSVSYEAYTGRRGEKGGDCRSWVDDSGGINFESTRPFLPGECLTLRVGWRKQETMNPANITIKSAPEDNNETHL